MVSTTQIQFNLNKIKQSYGSLVYSYLNSKKSSRNINYSDFITSCNLLLKNLQQYEPLIDSIQFTFIDYLYYGSIIFIQILFGVLYPGLVGIMFYYFVMHHISIHLILGLIVVSFIYTLSQCHVIHSEIMNHQNIIKNYLYTQFQNIQHNIQERVLYAQQCLTHTLSQSRRMTV